MTELEEPAVGATVIRPPTPEDLGQQAGFTLQRAQSTVPEQMETVLPNMRNFPTQLYGREQLFKGG